MQRTHSSHPFISALLWVILAATTFGTYLLITELNTSSQMYLEAQATLQKPSFSGSVATIDLNEDGKKMNIPSWEIFGTGSIWSLVSKSAPLPTSFTPKELADPEVPRGGDEAMKVDPRINPRLTKLVDAAETDGISLVLSSAYRSVADQEKLLAQFTQKEGAVMAAKYVAKPGSSEHHTGLSVDFAIDSDPCQDDSDNCSLGVAAAEWLSENAYRYGFIQRYPEGSESITGISYEPWHYRYVGLVLARELHGSGLTFDEFVELAR